MTDEFLIKRVYPGKWPATFEIIKQSPVRWQVRMNVGFQSFTIGPLVETERDAIWMQTMFVNALLNISELPHMFSDQRAFIGEAE